MTDGFSRFHPIVNFIFYIEVLALTMFQMQIGMIIISLVCAIIYHLYLKRYEGIKYLGVVLAVFLVSSVINPMFSHKGSTLLFYLFTGNPLTLESIIYGMAAAAIIGAVLLWFSTLNVVMTEDKILAGIGTVMPHMASLMSMVFRFVSRFTKQGQAVAAANKALGSNTKGIKNKIKTQSDIFSITATWALENSVDTADSMKARGYGTGRRTSYHNYKIQKRDILIIVYMVALFGFICIKLAQGSAITYYYPVLKIEGDNAVYITYFLLAMTPMFINLSEALRWRRLKSKT